MSGLGRPGVSAVKWGAVSTAARFGLQLGAQVVLARTLGPETFGIFALGMVVLTFANFVSGFGFSWSLLQRIDLRDEDVRFAWTWQVIVGLLSMVALYVAAPWLAGYFREARAEPVIQWLALACLLSAMAAPATYLLQRDLDFRAVGLIQVGSYAAGYVVVGMPMALMGWGVSSLVAAWIVQALVVFIASYTVKPHALKPLFWYEGGLTAVGTGKAVFFTNVVNWLLNNMDRILIGRLLNAQALGLYNVAYNLATMPNTLLLGALQPAFLAAGAQLQDQRERLGRVFVQMVATVLVLGLPAFGLLALLSPELVLLLYGDQWTEAGWVLGILFLCMPAYVLWGLATPVLWNTGRKQYEFALQLPLVAVGALAFYLLADQGIRVAAMVAGGLLVLRGLVMGMAALGALHLSPRVLVPHAARGMLLAGVCAGSAIAGQQLTQSLDSPFLSLAVSASLAIGLSLTVVLLRPQLLGEQTASMVLRFVPRLQSLLARALPVHAHDAFTPKHSEAT